MPRSSARLAAKVPMRTRPSCRSGRVGLSSRNQVDHVDFVAVTDLAVHRQPSLFPGLGGTPHWSRAHRRTAGPRRAHRSRVHRRLCDLRGVAATPHGGAMTYPTVRRSSLPMLANLRPPQPIGFPVSWWLVEQRRPKPVIVPMTDPPLDAFPRLLLAAHPAEVRGDALVVPHAINESEIVRDNRSSREPRRLHGDSIASVALSVGEPRPVSEALDQCPTLPFGAGLEFLERLSRACLRLRAGRCGRS